MTVVTRWNPFRDFDDMYRAGLNQTNLKVASIGDRTDDHAANQTNWLPAVDIVETEADFRLLLEIPAVSAQDVKVAVEDNVLTVSGEKQVASLDAAIEQTEEAADDASATPATQATNEVKYHRRERRVGRFSRSFRLPETVDEQAIEASAKDGVLTLVIAKRAQPQPRKIEVKVH